LGDLPYAVRRAEASIHGSKEKRTILEGGEGARAEKVTQGAKGNCATHEFGKKEKPQRKENAGRLGGNRILKG